MPSFKLRSPIPRTFFSYRKSCFINQLFGDNKNRLFYGPEGHTGIDFKTQFRFRYFFDNLFGSKKRENYYQNGEIPILAAHDGFLSMGYNDNERDGIYMKVTSDSMLEGKEPAQYETLYFHLSSVRVWKDDDKTTSFELLRGKDFVKAGTVVGWGGNTGQYTTGPHLHFELRRRVKTNGKWGAWVKIDPIPYLKDNTIYQVGVFRPRFFYKGKEISSAEAKQIVV